MDLMVPGSWVWGLWFSWFFWFIWVFLSNFVFLHQVPHTWLLFISNFGFLQQIDSEVGWATAGLWLWLGCGCGWAAAGLWLRLWLDCGCDWAAAVLWLWLCCGRDEGQKKQSQCQTKQSVRLGSGCGWAVAAVELWLLFGSVLACSNVLFDTIVFHNILHYVMVCDIMLEYSWFYNITYYNMTISDTMPYIVVGCYRVFCKLYCNIVWVWCYKTQHNTML